MAPTSLLGSLIPVSAGAKPHVLQIARGKPSQTPLHITDPVSHVCIVLEEGSQADITIMLTSDGEHACEVFVGDDAQCTVLLINAGNEASKCTIKQQSRVGAGSSLRWQNVTVGGGEVHHDLVSQVTGAHGESNIDWMFYAKGKEKQHLNVRNVFDANNGGGEVLMRGIAEEQAHIVCKGLIDIGLQGGGTNTYLTQEVLMLDASAKVDAVPSLEIKTNDVKASHSATVARVTAEDIFYFGARGINPTEARRMFVLGFLGDIIDRISKDEDRAVLEAAVAQHYLSPSSRDIL